MSANPTATELRPVRIVCAGIYRSGSTWSFNVVRRLLELTPPGRSVGYDYAEPSELDNFVWRSLNGEHHVVKCHAGSGGFMDAVRAGFVHGVVFSLRDPMAALASCVEQFCNREPFSRDWTFERALDHIEEGLRFGDQLVGQPGVAFIDLHRDGEAASLERIVKFMGLELAPAELDNVREEFSFAEMRERSAQIAEQPADALLRGINDPATLMHANHVEKGAARDWRSELSPDQIAAATERFAPYLELVSL
jgi:Sulfotransferase domain